MTTKILWHSVSPRWGTGYGQQTAVWVPRLAQLGYEVAISAFVGEPPGITEWRGHKVYPQGTDRYGADVLGPHARHFGADLVITFLDCYSLDPEPWADQLMGRVACWMPVDADNGNGLMPGRHIGVDDDLRLRQSAAQPIAMSKFGEKQLVRAGYQPLYVPHGIDLQLFSPPESRAAYKAAAGLSGRFVLGINATNLGNLNRKAWIEQLTAFQKLHERHKDTILLAHTNPKGGKTGYNLSLIVQDLGIREAVRFTDRYDYTSGLVTAEQLAGWYGTLDLLSACSYAEGFGLPVLEAQACGTPTVVTDGSAMSEVGCGWKVRGEPFYTVIHGAYWRQPFWGNIAAVYEKAYGIWKNHGSLSEKGEAARAHATQYDADAILTQHWKPVLAELERRIA